MTRDAAPPGVPQDSYERLICAAFASMQQVSCTQLAAMCKTAMAACTAAKQRFTALRATTRHGAWDEPTAGAYLDFLLKWADLACYALCYFHEQEQHRALYWQQAELLLPRDLIIVPRALRVAVLKYERIAGGQPEDAEAERRLIAALFPSLYLAPESQERAQLRAALLDLYHAAWFWYQITYGEQGLARATIEVQTFCVSALFCLTHDVESAQIEAALRVGLHCVEGDPCADHATIRPALAHARAVLATAGGQP